MKIKNVVADYFKGIKSDDFYYESEDIDITTQMLLENPEEILYDDEYMRIDEIDGVKIYTILREDGKNSAYGCYNETWIYVEPKIDIENDEY